MPKITIPFVGSAYEMPAIQLDHQNCINWYLSYDPTGKFPQALLPRPALRLWSEDSSSQEVRGQYELNNVHYAVINSSFRIYDGNGNYIEKGTLESSLGDVRIINNDTQLFITDGKEGYVYQLVKSATREVGDFFKIEEASSSIGEPTFTGGGLDDMSTGGTFIGTQSKTYRVEIDGANVAPNPDTFRWSDTDGDTWNAEGVTITSTDQTLNDGVTIQFVHKIGHTLHDFWQFDATIDSAFYVPIIPAYQDGYGIYAKQVTNLWYLSKIDDFSEVNATDFARTLPNDIVAAISVQEELWFLCRTTSEIWYNTGEEEFPFQRRTNLVMNYGCAAPYSVAVGHNNILFWLARNKDGQFIIVNAVQYNISIISTEALNDEIRKYSTVEDAKGWVMQWNGHIFYIIIFPTEDKTWAYDLTIQTWSQWSTRRENILPSDTEYIEGRWLANNYVSYNGKYLVGDYKSGNIYELTNDVFTDNGATIVYERTTRNFQEKLNRVCVYSVEIDFEKGEGLDTGQGLEPALMLRVSRDGGITWGNELWRTSGEIGKYQQRIKWNRLGIGRVYVLRLRVTDPVYNVVLGSVAEVEDTGL